MPKSSRTKAFRSTKSRKVPKASPRRVVIKSRLKKAPAKKPEKLSKKARELKVKTDRLIFKGNERGYVTYDEILKEFPTVEDDLLFLEELYEKFSATGIDVLEGGGMLDPGSADVLLD